MFSKLWIIYKVSKWRWNLGRWRNVLISVNLVCAFFFFWTNKNVVTFFRNEWSITSKTRGHFIEVKAIKVSKIVKDFVSSEKNSKELLHCDNKGSPWSPPTIPFLSLLDLRWESSRTDSEQYFRSFITLETGWLWQCRECTA